MSMHVCECARGGRGSKTSSLRMIHSISNISSKMCAVHDMCVRVRACVYIVHFTDETKYSQYVIQIMCSARPVCARARVRACT